MPALLFMQKREVMYGPQTAMEFEGNGPLAASGEPSSLFAEGGKESPGCLKIQHRQGDGGDHQKSDKSRHNADQERFPVRAAAVGRGFSGHTETPPFCKWLAPVLPSPVRLAQWTGGEAVSFHGSTIRAQTQGCVFPRGKQRARLKKAACAVETFWPPDASPSIGRRRCA